MQENKNPSQQGQYECDVCGTSFSSERELNDHKRAMHEEQVRKPQEERESKSAEPQGAQKR